MVVTKRNIEAVHAVAGDGIVCPAWYFEKYLDPQAGPGTSIVDGIAVISGCNACPYKDMFGSVQDVTEDSAGEEHRDTLLTVDCNYLKSLDPEQKRNFYELWSSMHAIFTMENTSRRAVAKAECEQ